MLECLEGAVPTVDTLVLFLDVSSLDCLEPLPPCELVDSPALPKLMKCLYYLEDIKVLKLEVL
jgi:hypothetical protein